MYFSLVNKGYGFYSQPVIMFKHAFGLLMGDFRFDNKIFTCVATHLAHNSAVKKGMPPWKGIISLLCQRNITFARLLRHHNKVRKLLFYMRKNATSHKGQKMGSSSWPSTNNPVFNKKHISILLCP